MKKIGLVRIDEVGRVVLPKEMRKVLKLEKDRLVEMYIEKDKLVLKKYSPVANSAERAEKICDVISSETGCICIVCDTAKVLCVSGDALKGIEGKKISAAFYSLIENSGAVLVNSDEGGKPVSPVSDPEIEYSSLAAVALEDEDCPVGAIALLSVDKDKRFGDCEMSLLKIAKDLIRSCCDEAEG